MKRKGFTLVELVIVIIIVGILSLVAIPIYRKYVREAKFTEAKALLSSVYNAQRLYYLENGFYYSIGSSVRYNKVLGIDARNNKFFTVFDTYASGHTDLWLAGAGAQGIAPDFNRFNIYWLKDLSNEGKIITFEGIIGATGIIPPFFTYRDTTGERTLLQS